MDMLLIALWLLVTTFKGTSGAEQETLCTSNTCFTVHMVRLSFEMARHSCEHSGGYLMTVRDREEENVLRSLLSKLQRRHQERAQTFWIGLKLHKGDCVLAYQALRGFKWISGEEDSSYSNWDKVPNNTCTAERCVRVLHTLSGEKHLKWAAGSCRTPSFYVCKFYFKGMCKPLVLLGSGQVAYTAPFSEKPQHYNMQLLPFGTFADISCSDQLSHLSMCQRTEDRFHWSNPGPFCRSGKQNCTIDNGGCQHLCQQDAGELRCFCKAGYSLEEDGLTCTVVDTCTDNNVCEHQCVSEESRYSCKCLDGFKLDANRHNCTDLDECRSAPCGQHLCVNNQGSYTCVCRDGYEMAEGGCSRVDECQQLRCHHGCSDTAGSLSCHCQPGFSLSQDGRSCVDVDECADDLCQFQCVNTEGGFRCTCPQGFHPQSDGLTCRREMGKATSSDGHAEEERHENFTEPSIKGAGRPQPFPDSPVNLSNGELLSNTSLSASLAEVVDSRVLICVLGSVVPLLLLVAVTLPIAIFRCNRSKKEAKKAATSGYCWVSPGLDPRLEKLYESILTDDL